MAPRTTTRHKSTNTFKFDTFAKRLEEVSNRLLVSDARGDFSRGALDQDDDLPAFYKCIQALSDLDLTENFTQLVQQIGTQIQVLAQIVHDQQRLVDLLYDHITLDKQNSLASTFELITALETDLGDLFQAHRQRFMKKIIKLMLLLDDVPTIEHAFQCLARMIKRGHIGSRINYFEKYVSLAKVLLNSKNISFQVLACQCFAHYTGLLIKNKPQETYASLLDLITKHDISPGGIAMLIYSSIRRYAGQFTLDGAKILEETINLCFQKNGHPSEHIWNEMVITLCEKLLLAQKGLSDDYAKRQVAARILIMYDRIQTVPHAHQYLKLMDIALHGKYNHYIQSESDSSSKGEFPFDGPAGIQKFFRVVNHDTWDDETQKQVCNCLVAICNPSYRLAIPLLLPIAEFLTFNTVSWPLRRRIWQALVKHPESITDMLSLDIGLELDDPTRLELYADYMIETRMLQHELNGTMHGMSTSVFQPQFPGELCTAIDSIRKTHRPYLRLQFTFGDLTRDQFCDAVRGDVEMDGWLRQCLSLTAAEYSYYLWYFTTTNPQNLKLWKRPACLQTFLVIADGYNFEVLLNPGILATPWPKCSFQQQLSFLQVLVKMLQCPETVKEGQDLWVLKTMDYLLAAMTPDLSEAPIKLNYSPIFITIAKYLRSGYAVLRMIAISIQYHIGTLKGNSTNIHEACKAALNMELWLLQNPSISETNQLMEFLLALATIGHLDVNTFLVNYCLGLLFCKFEPVKKMCAKVVHACCSERPGDQLDVQLLIMLKLSDREQYPEVPACLKRINNRGESVFEKYEYALFNVKSVGLGENGYTDLDYQEYCARLWEIVAATKDVSCVTKMFATATMKLARNILAKHVHKPPRYGFKPMPDGSQPSHLASVITWLGRCSTLEDMEEVFEFRETLIHFLMSTNPALRDAGIVTVCRLHKKPLKKYKESVKTYIEGKVVDLTGFGVDAVEPIILEESDRKILMTELVLPLIAQRLWTSLGSKRKVSSKSLSPILKGLMGFHEHEVKQLIQLVIGTFWSYNKKEDDPPVNYGHLYRRMRLIELMITTWEHAFPKLTERLLQMAVTFVRIADGDAAPGSLVTSEDGRQVVVDGEELGDVEMAVDDDKSDAENESPHRSFRFAIDGLSENDASPKKTGSIQRLRKLQELLTKNDAEMEVEQEEGDLEMNDGLEGHEPELEGVEDDQEEGDGMIQDPELEGDNILEEVAVPVNVRVEKAVPVKVKVEKAVPVKVKGEKAVPENVGYEELLENAGGAEVPGNAGEVQDAGGVQEAGEVQDAGEETGQDVEDLLLTEDSDTEGDTGVLAHRRQIIATGFRIVKYVYENAVGSTALLEYWYQKVFHYIAAPRLEKLVETSTGGVSTAMNFLKTLSQDKRYRILLLKILPASKLTSVERLIQVLEAPSTSSAVKKFVMEIFFDLLDDEPPELDESKKELMGILFKDLDYPDLSLETNILLHLKPTFLNFDTLRTFQKLVSSSGSRDSCSKFLKLVQIISANSTANEVKQIGPKLISDRGLVKVITKMNAKVAYLGVIGEIVKKLPDDEELLILLSPNFRSPMKSPEQKASLLGLLDGFGDTMCREALLDLCADNQKDLTAPDYARRQKGWRTLIDMFHPPLPAKFTLPRLMIVGNFLMGLLLNEKEAGTVQNALRVFKYISKMISALELDAESVKTFIKGVVTMPTLASILNWKNGVDAFPNVLLLLRTFVLECPQYDHILQGLAPLCNEEEDNDILNALTGIQVNEKTRAMNKLVKILDRQLTEDEETKPFKNCFGINLLRDYILPLATYGINTGRVDKSKTGAKVSKAQSVVDNLVDCSIKVYKSAVKLMSPMQYLRLLSSVLAKPPTDPVFAKRYKRLMLAIINGFPYTLVDVEEKVTDADDMEVDEDEESVKPEKVKGEKLIRVPDEEVDALTESYRPLLQRLNERLCNFTEKKGDSDTVDYSLMAECTLAVAKMLERFPPTLSEQVKDKLIPSICQCMKSKEHRTRLLARNTLRSLLTVRTKFISFGKILNYLKANLKVGFQKHVLNNTVSILLSTAQERFKANPSEIHVQSLLPLCEAEFFGVMEEEKSVAKIKEKTAEARAPNAQNILTICAEVSIEPTDILEMISCGLAQLKVKRSEKNLTQVRKWLDAIQSGLGSNDRIDVVEVLDLLQGKIDEIQNTAEDAASFSQASTSGGVAGPSKVTANSILIDVLPSKGVKDSMATENLLLLLFQFKFLYNSFRSFKEQYHIASTFYLSAVKNLHNRSLDIMLLSHRLVTMFLGWSQTGETVPKCLLPGGSEFNKLFTSLVQNVVKYCESRGNQETVNVIFTSLTTFLTVHSEMRLKKTDLQLLLSIVKKFLQDGHCVNSAMKFVLCVIELKVEAEYLGDIMWEMLRVSTRSVEAHVVETCHKVYIKYVLTYVSSRSGDTDMFLDSIWSQLRQAALPYQALNLLKLIEKIIGAVSPSSFKNFYTKLPVHLFEVLRSNSLEISNAAMDIYDIYLSLPNAVETIVPICMSLLNKKDTSDKGRAAEPLDPFTFVFITRAFNAATRATSRGSDEFLTKFGALLMSLMDNVDPKFQKLRKVAFQQLESIVQGFVKEWMWTGQNVAAWKLDTVIELMVRQGLMDNSHIIRASAVRVAACILNCVLESDRTELVNRLVSKEGLAREDAAVLPFLKNVLDLKAMIDGHVNVIKMSTAAQFLPIEDKVTGTLNLLTQLMCHVSSVPVPREKKPGEIPLATHFVLTMRSLVNEEVTHKATEFTVRRVCYTLLKTYVHLADAEEIPYDNIGLPGYEKFKGPIEFEPGSPLHDTLMNNIKPILHMAVRDSTDDNVAGDLRNKAEAMCSLLNGRVGPEEFIKLDAEIRKTLHERRRSNKAKKAEAAVNHPGLKRKRSSSKPKEKGGKRKRSSEESSK